MTHSIWIVPRQGGIKAILKVKIHQTGPIVANSLGVRGKSTPDRHAPAASLVQ